MVSSESVPVCSIDDHVIAGCCGLLRGSERVEADDVRVRSARVVTSFTYKHRIYGLIPTEHVASSTLVVRKGTRARL